MRRMIIAIAFAAATCLMIAPQAVTAKTNTVKVEQGLLSGTTGNQAGVRVFRGVPFAAPPVGDLRWKAPKAPASWRETREAKEFSPVCWQSQYPDVARLYQSELSARSEDCLYLNIWTPAKTVDEHLPVM